MFLLVSHRSWYALYCVLILTVAASTHRLIAYLFSKRGECQRQYKYSQVQLTKDEKVTGTSTSCVNGCEAHFCELNELKQLYFQLSNLERFYDYVLPNVQPILHKMFSEALNEFMSGERTSILDIDIYSREKLEVFLERENDICMEKFKGYTLRRRAGGSREMFAAPEDVSQSVRRLAPLKLADGAWLSHVHKISTPFRLRRMTQKAWQIFSEELGDGDLRKNHVFVYSELIKEMGTTCPEPHASSFSQWQHDVADCTVWKAAVAQQLMSIFTDSFLPEILGFNLHFEGVEFETLVTARELEELGYDPSYSLLHICIDNAHSGHSAIALELVDEYLCHMQQSQNHSSLQQAWNRVQTGYVLSQYLNEKMSKSPPDSLGTQSKLAQDEEVVASIIASKAQAAHGVHCRSAMRVGGLRISDWLDKERLRECSWRKRFLRALSNTKSLVCKGHSANSRLIKEVLWGGKMFGCFTSREVKALRDWIDGLSSDDCQTYHKFTTLSTESRACKPVQDQNSWTKTIYGSTPMIEAVLSGAVGTAYPFTVQNFGLPQLGAPDLGKLLPLWFASLGLLENCISVPSKVANARGCAVVRVLRAQHGLNGESEGVGGMDEAMRTDRIDLVDVGLLWMDSHGFERPRSVNEYVEHSGMLFAREMLTLAAWPEKNRDALIGLSCAFAELHGAVVSSVPAMVQETVREIAQRERQGLEEWLRLSQEPFPDYHTVCKAYQAGTLEIAKCF